MTNLLFSIVTMLVTNTSEQIIPERESNMQYPESWAPRIMIPSTKTVTTTISRVTNVVELASYRDPFGRALTDNGTSPRMFEIGRERISETTETLALVVTKTWERKGITVTTNWMQPQFWMETNYMAVGTNMIATNIMFRWTNGSR